MRLTPQLGGLFRRSLTAIYFSGAVIPEGCVDQVVHGSMPSENDNDLVTFRPKRHLNRSFNQTLMAFGGGKRVNLGKSLAEIEIRLIEVRLLQTVELQLQQDQDLALQLILSSTPKDGIAVQAAAR